MSQSVFTNEPDKDLIRCPYNASHQIRRSRFTYHLIKCQKQYPNIQLEKCPFLSHHHVRRDEMQQHKATCEGRARLEEYTRKFNDTRGKTEETEVKAKQPPSAIQLPKDNEMWDDLVGTQTYNPLSGIKDKNVIRTLRGKTKSERRAFNAKERERHIYLCNRADKKSSVTGVDSVIGPDDS